MNDDTANIIDAESMVLLRPGAVLVNTARGGIVNEVDLFSFLSANPEAFAAFDVFNEEPVKDNALFLLDNFFGTSHRSSLTYEGINAMGLAAIAGLDHNMKIN